MSEELPFEPYPFIDSPHRQTIISSVFNFLTEPSSDQKIVRLPDGDKISLQITTPLNWTPIMPTIFMVHGLCGSHRSPYLVRLVKKLEPHGIRCVRYNMRGCGSGKGLAKQIYHSGRSEDVFECLKVLKKEHPESPIILLGFSVGGNVVLKLVGELGALAGVCLKQVIAVSPPVELYSSVLLIGSPENAIYENYFYKVLRADVHYRHKIFKDLPKLKLPRKLKLYEFDQLYTAPNAGFSSVFDYYNKCSSAHLINDIEVPCRILLSEDDPIVSPHTLEAYPVSKQVSVFKTKKGGHMGYLGKSEGNNGLYWLDNLLFDWILKATES